MNNVHTQEFEQYGPALPGYGPVISIVECNGHVYADRINLETCELDTLTLVEGRWVELVPGYA